MVDEQSGVAKLKIQVTRQQRMAGKIACWDEMKSWS
jgi:hypothetical protein